MKIKYFLFLIFAFSALLLIPSCGKKEVCPTYAESNFLSKKKYNRQIKRYQNGKLIAEIKAKQKKESGDELKTGGKKKQKKPVPK